LPRHEKQPDTSIFHRITRGRHIDLLIRQAQLTAWGVKALSALNVPPADAELVACSLTQTSLWGIDSHGVARLPHYLARLSNHTINARPRMRFRKTATATGSLDGDHGLGIAIVHHGMQRAIRLARRAGIGIVGIYNSSHCGALGLYTRFAAAEGMIGIAFTHTDSLLMTFGGNTPFFGTNPISIAFPSPKRDPLCVDMATSIVPWNKIQNARTAKLVIPSGWAVDAEGNDCTDPEKAIAVKPIGTYKGYALSFLIDMLCGPLNGMAFGPHITSMYDDMNDKRRLGALVMAIDPRRFNGRKVLNAAVRSAIREAGSQSPSVRYPGQPEYLAQRERRKNGVPVSEPLQQGLLSWSKRLHIAPPVYNQ
jgi:ureidoglycolate dehydrogenase (NAD+)